MLRVNIRQAERADHGAIFQLAKSLAMTFSVEEQPFSKLFENVLANDSVCLALAEVDREVIGYVLGTVRPAFYANGLVGWVEELVVAKQFRGRGVGRQLMDHFEQWASVFRCPVIALATRRAGDFYSAIGYEESAIYYRKLISSSISDPSP